MDIPDVMASIATRIAQIPTLPGASYPALDRVPQSPWAMVRQSPQQPTRYVKARAGKVQVLPMIEVVLLIVSDLNKPREEARLDPLIGQVLDALSLGPDGDSYGVLMPDLPDHLDRVWDDATVQRGTMTWGKQECYAAAITVNPLFYRHALAMETAP